jgi:predicted aspartyl protease
MPVLHSSDSNLLCNGPATEVVIYPPFPPFESMYRKPLNDDGVRRKQVIAVIDTGADCSCIDNSLAAELGLVSLNVRLVHTPSGNTKQPVYDCQLHLPNRKAPNLAFEFDVCGAKLADQPYRALLGRDFLKHFTLVNNGWDNSYQLHL